MDEVVLVIRCIELPAVSLTCSDAGDDKPTKEDASKEAKSCDCCGGCLAWVLVILDDAEKAVGISVDVAAFDVCILLI